MAFRFPPPEVSLALLAEEPSIARVPGTHGSGAARVNRGVTSACALVSFPDVGSILCFFVFNIRKPCALLQHRLPLDLRFRWPIRTCFMLFEWSRCVLHELVQSIAFLSRDPRALRLERAAIYGTKARTWVATTWGLEDKGDNQLSSGNQIPKGQTALIHVLIHRAPSRNMNLAFLSVSPKLQRLM